VPFQVEAEYNSTDAKLSVRQWLHNNDILSPPLETQFAQTSAALPNLSMMTLGAAPSSLSRLYVVLFFFTLVEFVGLKIS